MFLTVDTGGAVFFGMGARGRRAPCPLAPPLFLTCRCLLNIIYKRMYDDRTNYKHTISILRVDSVQLAL